MAIDYTDERFNQVENEKNQQISEVTNEYNNMINNATDYYNQLKDETNKYAEKQKEIQQQQTDQTIAEINQNKEKAEKDYINSARNEYQDYKNSQLSSQINMRALGLQNSSYNADYTATMYANYQNKVSSAREIFNDAVVNYNNQITQAQIANSSALADIAFNALKESLEISLEGFQYKNELMEKLLNQKQAISDDYWNRRKDVESQINTENSLAEQIRQYNETMQYQKERDAIEDAQWQKTYNLQKTSINASNSSKNNEKIELTGKAQATVQNGTSANGYDDFYFQTSDGSTPYQPRYIPTTANGKTTYTKLSQAKVGNTKLTTTELGIEADYGEKKIWYANGRYYVWGGKSYGDYIDLTNSASLKNYIASKTKKTTSSKTSSSKATITPTASKYGSLTKK